VNGRGDGSLAEVELVDGIWTEASWACAGTFPGLTLVRSGCSPAGRWVRPVLPDPRRICSCGAASPSRPATSAWMRPSASRAPLRRGETPWV